MPRKQFTFYGSFYETIEALQKNKEKLQAYQLLCGYALRDIQPDLDAVSPGAATIFRIAQPILDTAGRRSQQAKKGGELKQFE